jgi:hypothetical protein
MAELDTKKTGQQIAAYRGRPSGSQDFRSLLEDCLVKRTLNAERSGYTQDYSMHPETIEAGVFANKKEPRITANLWASWMCGAVLYAYPERMVVKAQNEFFRKYAEMEIGGLLQGVYERPISFQAMVLA